MNRAKWSRGSIRSKSDWAETIFIPLPCTYPLAHPDVMRNLSLSSYETTSLSGVNFSATALDLDQKVLYVASERQNFDADVEVEIWRMGLDSTGAFVQVSIIVSLNVRTR